MELRTPEGRFLDGRICCSDPHVKCPACKAASQRHRAAGDQPRPQPVLKTDREWQQHFANVLEEAVGGVPPDGYAIALAKRGITPRTPDNFDPLDSYGLNRRNPR